MRHCHNGIGRNVHAFDLPDARLYERAAGFFMAGAYEALARDLANRLRGPQDGSSGSAGARVLDVGAGPGHLAVRLGEMVPGVEVTGVDIMPEMVDLANARARDRRVAGSVRFEEADVGELPFPDRAFDLVTSSFSMHHWDDPVRGLYEIRRVLRPGGRAVLFDLPPWLLRALGHGAAPPEVPLENLFSSRKQASVSWPVFLPIIRRYDLA
jgi:ubiquinone/menaquinone biosynthesis C-methylase UbiE